jgi:uncharacterized protein YfiM (DUF2279 family)
MPTKKPPRKKTMAASKKNRSHYSFFIILLFIILSSAVTAQDTLINRKKLKTFVAVAGTGYGLTLYGLNRLWYSDSERQSFRFFNDLPEWKQVDKLGHFYSSFYFSYGTSQALKGCGVSPKKSDMIGALTGFLILVPIEIFDGYSDAYGASTGDLIANAAGSSFFLTQKFLWKEVRLLPRFSFNYTGFAKQRPNVLGDSRVSEIFKDYNGQTYWISADMDKFISFPKWLNVAAGYGAQNMLNARDSQNKALGLDPYRQYYLSLDLDLSAIRTRSKFLKTLFFLANTIKIPAPAVEFSRKGIVFHPLHF